jgi:hypothetical protein
MAMKPIAVFVLVAVFSVGLIAASAKTVTMPAKNADEQSVNAVAGPPPAKKVADADKPSAQPSKKALKASKVKTPPPMHDPN